MISELQKKEIDLKILKVVEKFLKTNNSIEEISRITKISSSSVQRYLNDDRIIDLLGKDIYDEVKAKLKENKQAGLSKGGKVSVSKNEVIKDELGRFNGVRRK